MTVTKMLAGAVAALSLTTAPLAAQAATPTASARVGSHVSDAENLHGGGLVAILALVVVILGIIAATSGNNNNSNLPHSP